MTYDQLQFAISQYLDGTLPVEQRAELEQVLAGDESARRMLEEFRAFDGVLSQSLPLPEVKWDRLAAHLSATVAERGESLREALARPVDDQTQYAITQFLDGQLAAEEQAAIGQRIENEPAVRQVAEEYRSLDVLLKTALPTPEVNWEMLAGQISSRVDEAAARSRWSIGWVRGAASLALAACILIVINLTLRQQTSGPVIPGPQLVKVTEVAVLTPDSAAAGKPVIDISVTAASASADRRYSFAAAGLVRDAAPQLTVQVADTLPLPQQPDPFLQ